MISRSPTGMLGLAVVAGVAAGIAISAVMAPTKETEPPIRLPPRVAIDAKTQAFFFASYLRSFLQALPPEIPRTIEFPEIETDPVLWDFTWHSVLGGERRVWSWREMVIENNTVSTAATSTIWITTSNISSSSSVIYPATCSNVSGQFIETMIPAASGGYP